jgi:hypothetical protein
MLAVATVVAAVRLAAPPERLTEEDLAHIEPGMPLHEVEGALGGPAVFSWSDAGLVSDQQTFTTYTDNAGARVWRPGFREYQFRKWTAGDVSIVVAFDETEQVACRWRSVYRPPGLGSKLLRAMGW